MAIDLVEHFYKMRHFEAILGYISYIKNYITFFTTPLKVHKIGLQKL